MFRTAIVRRLLILAALISVAGPIPAYAQKPPKNPHWAVSFSATPKWHIAPFVENMIADEGETITFQGSELTIGFGRGSRRGGDWGVNYVRKPFKDGLITESFDSSCFQPGPNQPTLCNNSHERNTARGLMLSGVELHWFVAVARIKDRVQLGVNLAGGIASVKGTIQKTRDGSEWQFVQGPNGQGSMVNVPLHESEELAASEELMKKFPLIKVEFEGGLILTPALKVQMAAGLNFPSNSARVLFLYLIGGK